MAKSKNITYEEIGLGFSVNGNQAQAEFLKIGNSIRDMKAELTAVIAEMKQMEAEGKANTESYKDLTKQMKDLDKGIADGNKRRKELILNMKTEERTVEQLKQSIRSLKALRDKSSPDSEAYKLYNRELQTTRKRLKELETGGEQTGNVLTRMSSRLQMHFAAITAAIASVVSVFRKSFNTNLELEPINQALLTISGSTANFNRNMEFLRQT